MDIVDRLRNGTGDDPENHWLVIEAADEIERLRRDVDRMASLAIDNAKDTLRLREALKNMLRWHDQLSPTDIAKAEAALKEDE